MPSWFIQNGKLTCRCRLTIYDMCFTDRKTFELAVWEEKITDSLNYLFLLKAVIKEELEHQSD